jgi:hypothetical protein
LKLVQFGLAVGTLGQVIFNLGKASAAQFTVVVGC